MNKKIIFTRHVCDITGLSRMTLWRYIQAEKFPKPAKIENRNAWFLSTVEAWIDDKMGLNEHEQTTEKHCL